MSKIIEAKAIISAADKTGSVFDKLAAKIKGVEKSAKSLEGVKPAKFLGDFNAELARLKLNEKELQTVRKSFADLDRQLKQSPIRAAHYLRAIDDWKTKTVGHWREVKAGINEAEVAHKRFFKGAGAMALRGAGMLGGAYAAQRVARSGIQAAATGARESARDYLAGMTPADSARIKAEALKQSGAYQSVDSSTMHERLRDTAMSTRSTDKAIELGETIAQGTTVLQSLKGKDKAIEEGRKFFSALDVLGKNIDPKEVKELFNGYIKALSVEGEDMDLGGALQMARQSRAAGGILSNRFLMTTAPGLARDMGDAQLGTSLASTLGQNIGGRATKTSKAEQQKYGLRDAKGNFLDSRMMMQDPDYYAWNKLMPALEKQGISADDNIKVAEAMSKLFSNRTVQDLFNKLISQREQYQAKAVKYEKAPGLEAAGPLAKKDPFVAYEGVFAQLRNLAAQTMEMESTAKALGSLSQAIANFTSFLNTGKVPEDTRGGRWLKASRESGILASADKINERNRIENLEGQDREIEEKLRSWGLDEASTKKMRLKQFDIQQAISNSKNIADMPEIFSEAERQRWEDQALEIQRERLRGSFGGAKELPLPPSDPRKAGGGSEMPPVQSLEGANVQAVLTGSAEVKGEISGKFEVTASSTLLQVVESVKTLTAKVQGMYNANGPGSTGKSSPDAAAPSPKGNTGGGATGSW